MVSRFLLPLLLFLAPDASAQTYEGVDHLKPEETASLLEGRVGTREEYREALSELSRRHHVVISDEIQTEIVEQAYIRSSRYGEAPSMSLGHAFSSRGGGGGGGMFRYNWRLRVLSDSKDADLYLNNEPMPRSNDDTYNVIGDAVDVRMELRHHPDCRQRADSVRQKAECYFNS